MNKINNDRKIVVFIILCILTLIAVISAATYAFFSAVVASGQYITGSTGLDANSLSLTISQESVGTGKLIPQLDTAVQSAVANASGKGSCIDDDGNTVCKVYSIVVTNQSSVKMKVSGTLDLVASGMPNLKWAIGTSANSGFPTPENAYYPKSYNSLGEVTLEAKNFANNSKTYYVVIWISEQNSLQADSGAFVGTVSFMGYTSDATQGITSTFNG